MDEAVEGGEERDAVVDRPRVGLRVREQTAPLELHAQRPETLVGAGASCGRGRHGLGLRIDALGEIPQPVGPVSAGDRDHAALVQELEHPHQLSARPPPDGSLVEPFVRVLELA